MENEKLYDELAGIKERLTHIETDICWFKKLVKWVVLGICGVFGIEVAPYLI